MSGVPEIAIGTACDDSGDIVVRLAFTLEGAQQCVADLMPDQARQMAGVLIEAAAQADSEDAFNTRAAEALLANLDAREADQ